MKNRVRSNSLRFAPFATTVALAASVCAGGLALAGSASADEYSVQIGAFEKPETSFGVAAETIGKLYQTRNANGLTRLQVGRYGSMEEANVALRALVVVGYSDAYIVNKSARLDAAARETTGAKSMRASSSMTSSRAVSSSTPSTPSSTRRDDASLMANVPAELLDRTVLLDGRLHVIEGNRFIPLREYIAGSR